MSHELLVQSVSDRKIWAAIRVTSQNIPSPASREPPALGGWRNREEKLSPVTTLSPLWQRYSSGIVRDPDLLTAQTKHWYSYTSGWKCSDWQSSFYILVSLEEEKSETAAKNGSKQQGISHSFPIGQTWGMQACHWSAWSPGLWSLETERDPK